MEFLVKIQEVKAKEREDAVFECVLSNPFSKILWFGKNVPLEQGDKFDIEVSEDKLIHRLVVKDCMAVDKGIYSACAGIKSCNAWLIVEGVTNTTQATVTTYSITALSVLGLYGILKRTLIANVLSHVAADKDAQKGKKSARKTTRAGGSGMDLQKVAQEQQAKLETEREERKEQIKATKEAPPAESPQAPASSKGPAKTEPEAPKDPEPSKNDEQAETQTLPQGFILYGWLSINVDKTCS